MEKKKYIKRTRTWKTKSGEKKVRTYYYEVVEKTDNFRTTKKGKKIEKTFVNVTKKRLASINTVDKAKEYLKLKSESWGSEKAQLLFNEIRAGRTFTEAQIDERLSRKAGETGKRDVKNLLRALGYSKDEFMEAVGITETEFNSGTFRKIGNDIEFTTATGFKMFFQWDYDAGFIS